jgi:hypothetical protein
MLVARESCGLFEGLGRGDKNLIILPTTTWTATKWRETFEEQDWDWLFTEDHKPRQDYLERGCLLVNRP